jgi:two-component system, cell cycle sensor histidine kinase and response regulator CckA
MNVMTQFPAAADYSRDLPFHAMFEGAAIGIAICHLDGRILEANPALGRMLGYSQNELAAAYVHQLHPDLRHQGRRESESLTFSIDEHWLAELMQGSRNSFEIEKRYRRKDGSELWGHLTLSLGLDARRQPAFLIAMLADATERKQMEEHLREAEKMEVIGRLAGGIAHDFNNLLTGILLYCDLLSAGLENARVRKREMEKSFLESDGCEQHRATNTEGPALELSQHVEEMRRAGEQGAAMTQQLLAIARKQAAEPRPVPINETVASTENLLRRLIGEQIELVIVRDSSLDANGGLVLADPAQLRQILLNLVLNARDAMPQGGRITLSTRATEVPAQFPQDDFRQANPVIPRPAIALAVTDNGCGMNEETRAHLFEPFFTTKKPGEGTGLGLATVQRIVTETGGAIKVKSEPGQGTRIEVFFPAVSSAVALAISAANVCAIAASAEPASSIAATNHEMRPETGGKTILLVDDHTAARKSMQRLLLDAGYRVLDASSAQQALKLFSEQSEAPDLLIADFMMPGMSGQELAETLLRRKPGLKILLVSGFEDAPIGSSARAVELIRKPFSGRVLIERVVEVMHRQVS